MTYVHLILPRGVWMAHGRPPEPLRVTEVTAVWVCKLMETFPGLVCASLYNSVTSLHGQMLCPGIQTPV